MGFTTARDANGDGNLDWDCGPSEATVYPGAPEICGDALDNACTGYVDRTCFTPCAGSWPFQFESSTGASTVQAADLRGDGDYEIIVQNTWAFAILDSGGQVLVEEYPSTPGNFSRGAALVADVDDYDTASQTVQTLEVLTANGKRPRFYKLGADDQVSRFENLSTVIYDASLTMARDLDGDGSPEFLTTSECLPNQGTRVFRFDRGAGTIAHLADIADPDGACEYVTGRTLTDLDGDGVSELLFGNGYAQAESPSRWKGNIHALRFTSLGTLATESWCDPATCFPTRVDPLFGGAIGSLVRVGDEIRASGSYFFTDIEGAVNPGTTRYWRYDLLGNPLAGSPGTEGTIWLSGVSLGSPADPALVTSGR
jgi:hypothetical protein